MTTLVVLPGLDGTGLLLKDFAAAFAPGVKLVLANYPVEGAQDYRSLEEVARRFLPLDEPYFLLGESFSGPLALTIAASRPPALRGVILACSFARSPRPALAQLSPLVNYAPVAGIPNILLSWFVLGRFATPALRQALAEVMVCVPADVLRARAKAALRAEFSWALTKPALPLLYLRATEDRVVPPTALQYLRSLQPSLNVAEFVAPHFLLQVEPQAVASVITAFMDGNQ